MDTDKKMPVGSTACDDFYAAGPDHKWEKELARITAVLRTRKEARRKLLDRGCPAVVAEKLLDRFQELGLIDDRMYARLFAESKRDHGLRRIRDELRARGVSSDDIEDVLYEADIDETQRALELLRRWHGQSGMTSQKLRDRLLRRGFSSSAVREAIDSLCEENGDDASDDDGDDW